MLRKEGMVVPVSELVPIAGCGCCILSCLCDMDNCFGCIAANTCLCLRVRWTAFKPTCDSPEQRCICLEANVSCIDPATCCKCTNQLFCLDNRLALPCDNDVPCILSLLFMNCCYNWKCKPACFSNVDALSRDV